MMGHWIADGIFLLIGVALILIGAKRGFIKAVIHSCKLILSFIFAYLFGGKMAQFLCERFIGTPVRNFVYDQFNGMYQQAAESFNSEKAMEALPSFVLTDEVQAKITAAEGSGEQLVNNMTDAVATPIASVFSNIIGYIAVFVISLIVLWVVATLLSKLVEHVGILGRLNKLLGALWGALTAVVLLFVFSSVFKFFFADSALYTESILIKFFGESSALETLNFLDIGKNWLTDLVG